MTIRSTNYYGYDKETYNDCKDLIDETNRRHIDILNIWFFLINVLCVIMSVLGLFSSNLSHVGFYLIYVGISVAFFALSRVFNKLHIRKLLTVQIALNVIIWMAYSIQVSVDQPYMAATLFIVMMVVLSFSFITSLGYMLGTIIIANVIFLYSSYKVKTYAIVAEDFFNSLIFASLAIILHFAFQRTRMQQFVTFQKNAQIQRELEIKSSFDALTSLLNRGRFFSLAGNILSNPHDEYLAMCLVDLDEFKQINDKLGHQMGDKAIQVAGSAIIDSLNIDLSEKWAFQERVLKDKTSFPGRLGGDEFIVFIRGASGRDEVVEILENMLSMLNSVEIGELHGIHASMGVTEILSGDDDIDKAYKRADEALYESKRAGKNQIRFSNMKGRG